MKDFEKLKFRAAVIRSVRTFFERHDFVEVMTPVAVCAPAPEEFIEAISCSNRKFLRTSPELAMKTLLGCGAEKIFDIGSCFRADEHGWKHSEEFTMLEWYEKGADYNDLRNFTAGMVNYVWQSTGGGKDFCWRGQTADLAAEPEVLTVRESFERYSRFSAEEALKKDIFDEEMVLNIEPELGKGRMTFLTDYPACRGSLARLKKSDPGVAERWELYLCGVELANAYGELTDAAEQRRRFTEAAAFREAANMAHYPENSEFFAALEHGIGECSGCALGLDRLIMLFAGCEDISEIQCVNLF